MNCLAKPIEFTQEQLAKCRVCRHVSAKKIWCCKWGINIERQGKIITPSKNLQYPSKLKMAGNFAKAVGKYILSGGKKRTDTEQLKCMEICKGNPSKGIKRCDFYNEKATFMGVPTPRCYKCGCCSNLATRWATKHCPIGMW